MITSAPPRQVLVLLWCARCRHRLCPESLTADIRSYQCSNGCRVKPVPGPWLEQQITRVLAGRVRPERADTVIERITVADPARDPVRITWHAPIPARPQPPTDGVPLTVFIPAVATHTAIKYRR